VEEEEEEAETVMEDAEEEQRRRLKLEEALEIQSLRRIISAYLKYNIHSFFTLQFNFLHSMIRRVIFALFFFC